jgi:hypothetical protein
MKYTYLLAGISLSSDIFFPELTHSNNTPEVLLSYGDVPEHLTENKVDFTFIEENNKQYLLKQKGFGKILLENGNTIILEKEKKANHIDLERYVLTNILGILSYQRNYIPMHGGVFEYNGKGILITGLSGNGKSTFLAALYKKGYKIISDDISNVQIIDKKAFVQPCFPNLLLWKKTADILNIKTCEENKLRSDAEKYIIPIHKNQYHDKTLELSHIYVLLNKNITEDKVELKGLGKIETLRKNTYRPWYVKTINKQKEHFMQLGELANSVNLKIFSNDHKIGIEQSVSYFIEKINQDVK